MSLGQVDRRNLDIKPKARPAVTLELLQRRPQGAPSGLKVPGLREMLVDPFQLGLRRCEPWRILVPSGTDTRGTSGGQNPDDQAGYSDTERENGKVPFGLVDAVQRVCPNLCAREKGVGHAVQESLQKCRN
jgi:hypothetical protein